MRRPSPKARLINWGCVGPLLAYLAVAAALVAAAIVLDRHSAQLAPAPSTKFIAPVSELTDELARCEALGRRAEDDSACLAAWRENRRRFFRGNPQNASNPESTAHP